jgi:hypothetical protein
VLRIVLVNSKDLAAIEAEDEAAAQVLDAHRRTLSSPLELGDDERVELVPSPRPEEPKRAAVREGPAVRDRAAIRGSSRPSIETSVISSIETVQQYEIVQ